MVAWLCWRKRDGEVGHAPAPPSNGPDRRKSVKFKTYGPLLRGLFIISSTVLKALVIWVHRVPLAAAAKCGQENLPSFHASPRSLQFKIRPPTPRAHTLFDAPAIPPYPPQARQHRLFASGSATSITRLPASPSSSSLTPRTPAPMSLCHLLASLALLLLSSPTLARPVHSRAPRNLLLSPRL